jgi:hypothetical protein
MPVYLPRSEWLLGATSLNGKYFAIIQVADGSHELAALDTLGLRGIPTPSNTQTVIVRTDLSEWSASFDLASSFANVFGHSDNERHHQLFQFDVDGREFVMPALVFMRAVFRPNRHVLPRMFRPQGIDRVCTPSITGDTFSVEPLHLPPAYSNKPNSSISRNLAWILSFPTSVQMCASIYEHILDHRIGLFLPNWTARMRLTYVELGAIYYVVDLGGMFVETNDQPYAFANKQPSTICWHDSTSISLTSEVRREFLKDISILEGPDGSTDLSDGEWELIQQLSGLNDNWEENVSQLQVRSTLNNILEKLQRGTEWSQTCNLSGSSGNQRKLYNRLRSTGSWTLILSILATTRDKNSPASAM